MTRHATHPTLRLATKADIEAMRSVYAPYIAGPITFDVVAPTPEQFAARMEAVMPTYPCLVVEYGNDIVGFAYAHAQAERAAYRWNAELSVYLAREATGRGWGRAPYEALLELLRMQGIKTAYALVTIPNGASERLHEKLGFARCWVQPQAGWKNGAWHDVAWYTKRIDPCEGEPADPLPFMECVRARTDDVRRILACANANLALR